MVWRRRGTGALACSGKIQISVCWTNQSAFKAKVGCTYKLLYVLKKQCIQNFFGIGTVGYDYSLADLQKFGVANIELLDEEWDWRKYRPDRANLVKRIKVDDDYKFGLNRFEIN